MVEVISFRLKALDVSKLELADFKRGAKTFKFDCLLSFVP